MAAEACVGACFHHACPVPHEGFLHSLHHPTANSLLRFVLLQDELARLVTQEQGKTFQDARGDVFRGLGELHVANFNAGGPSPRDRPHDMQSGSFHRV